MSVRQRRLAVAVFLALGLGVAAVSPAASEGVPAPLPAPLPTDVAKTDSDPTKLSVHSQELLADAVASGRARVTVMALTAPGRTATAVRQLGSVGAVVGFAHDKVGYVRASVPTDKVVAAARLGVIQSMDLDETLAVPRPIEETKAGARGSAPWTGPSRSTPAVNPYLPTHETGAVRFTSDHPDYDGRDITIGVLDSGVDLDHPALATTTQGERKIADWVTATDPLLESDGSWRPMLTRVTGPDAAYGGATWTLPAAAGDYAMNVFTESSALKNEDIKGDINRDGDTDDVWGVLYDYRTHDIRVDVDQDRDFTDEKVMRPYREKFDVGHFGTDDPATDIPERMPFVVEFRTDVDLTPAGLEGQTTDFVNIGVVAGSHGTHVAGIAAGRALFGGAMNGAAPGAKVVSSKACIFAGGCTTVALSEGMIDLVANRRVDVVNLSIGGLPALNDGNNTRARLYDRLLDTYGVQIFISAGNEGPGLNTVGDPAVATDAVAVGATASRDTWKANYGADASADQWVQNYSSRGPREDGGFKPDVSAPGSAISTIPSWMKADNLPQVSYKLPAGYSMFNGTSMAAPQATGAAALLLSAARAQDTPVLPRRLRESLYSTARFLPGVGAVEQGTGLLDVGKAWEALRSSHGLDGAYTITAPVCSPLSDMLATKNAGAGIYNRCSPSAGGQRLDADRTYEVTITRTRGSAGAARHALRWVGGDGTFTSPGSVDLPLDTPVTVQVHAKTSVDGLHSAYLAIDSPDTPLVDARMMAAVAVGLPLTSDPFEQRRTASIERVRTVSSFLDVPAGAEALQVNLSGIAPGSMIRWTAVNPYGVPVDDPVTNPACYTNEPANPKLCRPTSRAYPDPLPGLWEIQVEASRKSPFSTNPFTLQAAVQGTTVTPEQRTLDRVSADETIPLEWKVRNDFSAVTITGRGGPIGSAWRERPTIREGEKKRYTVEVPAGAAQLRAAIGRPSDRKADLDLLVYAGSGAVVGQSAGGDATESVTIPKPPAGTYTVEVDAYDVPSASGTQFDYLDVFTSPALGRLTAGATTATLAGGEETTMKADLVASAAPQGRRRLLGELRLVSAEGAVLGRGEVLITSVTK